MSRDNDGNEEESKPLASILVCCGNRSLIASSSPVDCVHCRLRWPPLSPHSTLTSSRWATKHQAAVSGERCYLHIPHPATEWVCHLLPCNIWVSQSSPSNRVGVSSLTLQTSGCVISYPTKEWVISYPTSPNLFMFHLSP